MGNYTTATKVRQLYPLLNDLISLTDGQIDFYISQAEAELNGRLASRYALPFSATPPLIEALSTEYALIKLMDRFYSSEEPKENAWKSARRRDLKTLLTDLAAGDMTLVNSAYEVIAQRTDGGIASDTSIYTPTFTHIDATQELVDLDRVDDEEDALD